VKGKHGMAVFIAATMQARLGDLAQAICRNESVQTFIGKAITAKLSLTHETPMSFMSAGEVGGIPAFTNRLTAVGLGNG
jgi:hypothetical protein